MKLSEIKSNKQTITLVNDSDFYSLGMATSVFNDYGVLSFLNDEKYIQSILLNDKISSVITNSEIAPKLVGKNIGILACDSPKSLFL